MHAPVNYRGSGRRKRRVRGVLIALRFWPRSFTTRNGIETNSFCQMSEAVQKNFRAAAPLASPMEFYKKALVAVSPPV